MLFIEHEIKIVYFFFKKKAHISDWLSKNFLKINHNKTEVLLVGRESALSKCKPQFSTITLGDVTVKFSSSARNLGVLLDENLSFKQHIQNVSNNCIYHLKNLNSVRSHFSRQSLETAIHAYVSTRLDYCNSLYIGLPDSTLRPLQFAQNFAARGTPLAPYKSPYRI